MHSQGRELAHIFSPARKSHLEVVSLLAGHSIETLGCGDIREVAETRVTPLTSVSIIVSLCTRPLERIWVRELCPHYNWVVLGNLPRSHRDKSLNQDLNQSWPATALRAHPTTPTPTFYFVTTPSEFTPNGDLLFFASSSLSLALFSAWRSWWIPWDWLVMAASCRSSGFCEIWEGTSLFILMEITTT